MKLADILDQPKLYSFVQRLLKTKRYENNLSDLIGNVTDIQVLDFGCGPGDLYKRFTKCNYIGIDPLDSCIKRAQSRYGPNNDIRHFMVGDHLTLRHLDDGDFDLVIAIGVLHHITDDAAVKLMSEVKRILKPNSGRFITLDPVRHTEESKLSGFLVSQDRGRYVRTPAHYETLFRGGLKIEQSKVVKGLIRIPYDQFVTVSS